jgi:hypothetical protein
VDRMIVVAKKRMEIQRQGTYNNLGDAALMYIAQNKEHSPKQ